MTHLHIHLEVAGLKEAFSFGAINLECYLRNMERLERELELMN